MHLSPNLLSKCHQVVNLNFVAFNAFADKCRSSSHNHFGNTFMFFDLYASIVAVDNTVRCLYVLIMRFFMTFYYVNPSIDGNADVGSMIRRVKTEVCGKVL